MNRQSLRRGRAVDLGRVEDVGRQRFQSRKQDQRHERRPFPGVDRDQGGERALRIGEQAARTGKADLRQGIAEHAVFRTEQRLEHEPDHQRRHGRRNEQKPERDPVEPVVAPQEERDAKTEDEFDRHRAEREHERVDHRAARGRVAPQGGIVVEPDEMARTGPDQVVAVERVEKPLDHRPDRDRQHVKKRRRREARSGRAGACGRKGSPLAAPQRRRRARRAFRETTLTLMPSVRARRSFPRRRSNCPALQARPPDVI